MSLTRPMRPMSMNLLKKAEEQKKVDSLTDDERAVRKSLRRHEDKAYSEPRKHKPKPARYVMVPVKPTKTMIKQGVDCMDGDMDANVEVVEMIWKLMVASRPAVREEESCR